MFGRSTKQRRAAMRRKRLLALVRQPIVTLQQLRASGLRFRHALPMLGIRHGLNFDLLRFEAT